MPSLTSRVVAPEPQLVPLPPPPVAPAGAVAVAQRPNGATEPVPLGDGGRGPGGPPADGALQVAAVGTTVMAATGGGVAQMLRRIPRGGRTSTAAAASVTGVIDGGEVGDDEEEEAEDADDGAREALPLTEGIPPCTVAGGASAIVGGGSGSAGSSGRGLTAPGVASQEMMDLLATMDAQLGDMAVRMGAKRQAEHPK